jgi:hypothetical protein
VSLIIIRPLAEIIEELDLILPLKDRTETGDIGIFLEETPRLNVAATFALVVQLVPFELKDQSLFKVGLCLLEMPLTFRYLALKKEHLTGREIFMVKERQHYLKAINLDLVVSDTPNWEKALEFVDSKPGEPPLFESLTDSDDEPDPTPPRPNLTLVK